LENLVAYALIHDEYKNKTLKKIKANARKSNPPKKEFFKTPKKYPVFVA